MFKKITVAVLLGIFGTLFFAQYDPWTHKKIIEMGQKISRDYLGGNFSCSLQSLSFFSPSVVLCDVEMNSMEPGAWSWRCKKCEVSCSWLQLLFKGVMDQHMVVDEFECSSRSQGMRCAIEPHCIAMMQKSFLPFPTELKSVIFKNAHCFIDDRDANITTSFFFNSSSLRIGQQLKTAMSVSDGEVRYEKNKYIEKIATDISLTTGYIGDLLDAQFNVAGTFVLSHLEDRGGCYLSGQWKSDHGRFSVRSAHNCVMIDPIIITPHDLRVNGRFPLSYAMQCIRNSTGNQMINGTALIAAKISRDTSRHVDGQLVVEDVMMNQHHLCDTGKIVFARHGHDWRVKLGINRRNEECKGSGYWHEVTGKGELVVNNATELSAKALPYWRIKHNNFSAHVEIDNDTCVGSYSAVAKNILSNGSHTAAGDFSYNKGAFTAHALIDDNELNIALQRFPTLKLEHCSYKDKDKKSLIVLQQSVDNAQQIKGVVSFPFVRSLIHNALHYDLQGEGSLSVIAELSPSAIVADLAFDDATIRLPQTYNFIDGFNAHCVYNIANSSCVAENINLSLHTGTVSCLRATMYFNSNGALTFAHAPLLLDRCLLNIKKDLFAIVSGNLLFSKDVQSGALVSGRIVIDKAQLKENLFSGIIQKQLLAYTHSAFSLPDVPVKCDLTIETKSPIRVDTALLQTNAKVNVRVQKDMQDPSVVGSIVLYSGMLNFPYKPLYISKGVITFSPEQLFDPAIELIARNKIKKYDVSLQVEGTLSNHHIVLDSTPPLSEEQIVGLLLVGSEENSLNSMMPALIVQNLKNLIFSNNQSTFLDKYFKPLLRTFNINLVPSFTDQTGRGGLRGALEITVDERWRAVIQKNFSLTEDTKFELEFLLSDDVTLRAIRDERRDIGGEVEMRWKF
jgi:hypothetical protein